jgi:hypothetical protein
MLTRSQRDALEAFWRARGEVQAAAELGISRNTLRGAAGGFGIQRSTAEAILRVVAASKLNTGGDEAPRSELNTRTRSDAEALDDEGDEAHGDRGSKERSMQKILIPIDADINRAIEARRRSVPLDEPVRSRADVVRELIRAGIASSAPVAAPFAPVKVTA